MRTSKSSSVWEFDNTKMHSVFWLDSRVFKCQFYMFLLCYVDFVYLFQVHVSQRHVRAKTEKNGHNGTKKTLCCCHDGLIAKLTPVRLKPRAYQPKEIRENKYLRLDACQTQLMPVSLENFAFHAWEAWREARRPWLTPVMTLDFEFSPHYAQN